MVVLDLQVFKDILINQKFLNITLLNWTLCFGLLILFIILRNVFSFLVIGRIKKFTEKTKTKIDDEILKIIEPSIRLLFITFGLYISFSFIAKNNITNTLLTHVIKSLFIIAFFLAIYRSDTVLTKILEKFFKSKSIPIGLGYIPFFNKLIKFLIIVFALIFILQEWGYNIGAIITGLGIGGLAVALAARDTLANLFGSLIILFDKPFQIGDWIVIGNIEGTVEDIGFRSTKIRTFAQALVSVPNSKVANESIINWSKMGKRRIKFMLGIKYSTPVDKIKKAVEQIREMLLNHPEIHKQTVFVYFNEFGDSSLNIFLYFFTITTNWQKYLEIREDVFLKIMKILEELDIEIAFPSTSIYFENPVKIENS